MSKLIDKIEKIAPNKIGSLSKILCSNCLGEKSIRHPITGWKKCFSCGATDFETIHLMITYWYPTGHEL